MTPDQLSAHVLMAARDVFADREWEVALLPSTAPVERPRQREHGDYASNLALQLAKRVGVSPRELAGALAERLGGVAGVKSVEVAGPGFLNIWLEAAAAGELARVVVEAGPAYGQTRTLAGLKINLEFVSANPVGPVHLGAVRWAAVGDALARLLRTTGAEVTTEYYFNDAGSQIDRFGASLLAAARGEEVPGDGYAGAYITDIAAEIVADHPGGAQLSDPDALRLFRTEGVQLMFREIKSSLATFGVHFDVYFNEKELHARGELTAALAHLRANGHLFERDGATWLRTTEFGDDKDRVLVRQTGAPTYFLADCAYYYDRRQVRHFDRVAILLGADHHGYVARMRAMAACFGDNPDQTLEILIGQLVNLIKDGVPVRMSKRHGTVVGLEDVIDTIGVDAARYALARYSMDSPIDIDIELWTRATRDNPVYYVQYAHARIASLLRNAAELGITRGEGFDPGLLGHERELDLLKVLGEFPQVVAAAAELREPHRVARYCEELAGAYHRFYDSCRVLPQGDELVTDLTRARLWLVEAARIGLGNGLGLLGVTAPERM